MAAAGATVRLAARVESGEASSGPPQTVKVTVTTPVAGGVVRQVESAFATVPAASTRVGSARLQHRRLAHDGAQCGPGDDRAGTERRCPANRRALCRLR